MHRLICLFLTLLLLCMNVVVVNCAPACSITTDKGGLIDLSNIDIAGTGYTVAATDANYNFYFNICGAITNPSAAICSVEAQAYQYSKTYNLCYPIGHKGYPKVTFLNPADQNAGVKVVHIGIISSDGVSRQLSISLSCDYFADVYPTLSFTGEKNENGVLSYTFSGKTKSACSPKASSLIEWGKVMEVNLDNENFTFPYVNSFVGNPTIALQFYPNVGRNIQFYIGNCVENGWNSVDSVKKDYFYQNYGCISLIAQELATNKSVPTLWEFSDSNNEEMMTIIQSNTEQRSISRDPNLVRKSFMVNSLSSAYNFYYAKKINFNYTKLEIGQTYSIQSDNSKPFSGSLTITPHTYFQFMIENSQDVGNIYIGKKAITWNINQDEFYNYDYQINSKSGEIPFIYSGESTEYYVVFSKGGHFQINFASVDYLFTMRPIIALGVLFIISIVGLCIAMCVLLLCFNRKKKSDTQFQELHEKY